MNNDLEVIKKQFEVLREELGEPQGSWTVSEHATYFGFFCHGWNARSDIYSIEKSKWNGVEQFLIAAADGSMSRNNSEQLASELLEQIRKNPCECRACIDKYQIKDEAGFPLNFTRMVLCKGCGNKRCPKASDHRNACTQSNEAGQDGSVYK